MLSRYGAIAAAFLFFVLVFVWGENSISHSFQACVNQESAKQSTNNPNKYRFVVGRVVKPQIVCSIRLLDAHNGFIAAIAGGFVAVFTLTLWRSTVQLWLASERQHTVSNRAFVFLDEIVSDIRSDALVIRAFWIIPKWRNSGNTPTNSMICRIHQIIHEGDLPDTFNYRYYNADFPLVIGPHSTEYSPVIEINGAQGVIADQNAPFRTPFRQLFIYGRTEYQDVFNTSHFTQWCYRAHFYSLDAATISVRFTQWGSYNRTDDEGHNAT